MSEKVKCIDCEHFGVVGGYSKCKKNAPTHEGYPPTTQDGSCGQGKRRGSMNNSNTPLQGELLKG